MNLLDRPALLEGEADITQTVGVGRDKPLAESGWDRTFRLAADLPVSRLRIPLAKSLFERAADGHHFADRLHLRAEHGFGAGEFLELPAWDLHHDVVERGLEAGRRDLGDVVLDFIQPVADRQFGGDLGDGKSGGFGGQRGAARDARIHFDDDHAAVRAG